MYKVIVIIPCYNEEKNINQVMENIRTHSFSDKYIIDCIVINDCSKDGTLDICKKNGYDYLNLSSNLGIGGCVQAGYLYACERGYNIAIQHDGDGQHDPGYFENAISPIVSEQADIVIGSRFADEKGFQSTRLRQFGIVFLSNLIYLCTGVKIYDVTSGYRAVNREFIEFFAARYAQDYPEPESIVDAALNNARILEIPVIMHERKEGKSSITPLKSLYYMFKVSLSILLHRIIVIRRD